MPGSLRSIAQAVQTHNRPEAGPALAFWRPYANKNLAAPDHHESVNHKSQSVTVVTIES